VNSPLIRDDMLRHLGERFWPRRCTIQKDTPTRTSSGMEKSDWANLADHVAIHCRLAPIETRQDQEVRQSDQTVTTAGWWALLRGYFPAITTKHRALMDDGAAYNIIGVDVDSERKMTRLTLQRVS
jgi:head-tail adaptor